MNTNQYTILTIVNHFESVKIRRIKIVFFIAMISFIVVAVTKDYFFGHLALYQLCLVISVAILFISGITLNFAKKTTTIGKIELNETGISGILNEQKFSEKTSDIVELEFEYAGFDGEPIPFSKTMNTRSGNNNYITIKTKAGQSKYHVYIGNLMKVVIIKRLLNIYETQGIKINADKITKAANIR